MGSFDVYADFMVGMIEQRTGVLALHGGKFGLLQQ